MSSAEIWAVVILYRPNGDFTRRQFEALAPQVAGVIYYDNSGGRDVLAAIGLSADGRVRCTGDGENVGIAEGLNRGITLARELGAAFVLLLDQDSVPAPDMVMRLQSTLEGASAAGKKVGALGPAIFDELSGRLEDLGSALSPQDRHAPPVGNAAPVEVQYLITSGTLIPMSVLDDVGLMESELFIDAVDFEWSFRARMRGYHLYGTYGTRLHHNRGQGLHRIPILGARFRLFAPERHFYIFRNHLRLCFRGYMPLSWKLRGLWYLAVRTTLFGLFVADRGKHLSAMARGTWQALGDRRPPAIRKPQP